MARLRRLVRCAVLLGTLSLGREVMAQTQADREAEADGGVAAPTSQVPALTAEPVPRAGRAATSGPLLRAPQGDAVAGLGGFGLRSPDGLLQLTLHAGVVLDGRAFPAGAGPSASPGVSNVFTGVAIQVRAFERFTAFLVADVGGQLYNSYVEAQVAKEFNVRVGKEFIPAGYEVSHGSCDQLIWYGYTAKTLNQFDFGVFVNGNIGQGLVEYDVGMANGAPDWTSAGAHIDRFVDLVGSVSLRPFSPLGFKGLQVRFGGLYGLRGGTATSTGLSNYRSYGEQLILAWAGTDLAAGAQPVVADGAIYRIVPSLNLAVGPFGVYGEYVRGYQAVRRPTTADEVVRHGTVIDATKVTANLVLTGEEAVPIGALAPRRGLHQGGPGAWQLIAELSTIAFDGETLSLGLAAPGAQRGATTVTAGLAWYPVPGIKWLVDYGYTAFSAPAGVAAMPGEHVVHARAQAFY